MKKLGNSLCLWAITLLLLYGCSQPTEERAKMSVEERLEKARAAKSEKQTAKAAGVWVEKEKATPADYQSPVERQLKGPNGEEVHIGERGAKYYINKNGNKTYLSSNQ